MKGKGIGDEGLLAVWPSEHWKQIVIDLVRNGGRMAADKKQKQKKNRDDRSIARLLCESNIYMY